MKTGIFSLLTILFVNLFSIVSFSDSDLRVRDLRCEYQRDPLAIDSPAPRLSWILESPRRSAKQTAYRILVATEKDILRNNTGDLWDSGKVSSNQSMQIAYAGKSLASFQRCFWKVRVWDGEGNPSPWSDTAIWSMGILQEGEWNAKWIGAPEKFPSLPIFRREFSLDRKVKSARVYISGLGFYELRINGEKVGDSLFDPGWTNYRRTCMYAAYDVTKQVRRGGNALGVMLGNGFFNVTGGRYVKYIGSFGEPRFILHLRVEYADGSIAETVSDESWRCSPGPILFSCIYGGEDYDARLEIPGWDETGLDDSAWKASAACEGPGGQLAAQIGYPIRVQQEWKPVKMTEPRPGVKVYDLGQNFAGIPALEVRGERGSQVTVTPAELITGGGLANQSASGGPHTYTYTLKGGGVETWQPRFTYYGFRYLQVETAPGNKPPDRIAVRGLFTCNSSPRVGAFECSSALYNRIHQLIGWSVGSNYQSVLTDCPHREKLGWLEVAHLMAPSITYHYDTALFYTKVLRDIRDSQLDNGLIPDIAPEYVVFSGGFRDSPEWGSAGVILPWFLYEWFGDRRALEQNYESMQRYVDYLSSQAKDGIVQHGLGDWYDYVRGEDVGESRLTPKALTATAMYFRDTVILQKAAKVLGKSDDVDRYGLDAERIRNAFHRHLFNADTRQFATGSQTANAIPLVWNIVDANFRDAVLQNLVKEVTALDYLTSGDVGFRFLIRALADAGRSDLVYRLTHRTDEPGYGYQIEGGATSLTEAWDGRKVVSHNHCMLGHLQEWFQHDLLGIRRDPSELAFQKIVIHPNPVGDIAWAKGYYDSPHGRIACEWKRESHRFIVKIAIPANTTATVYMPVSRQDSVKESGRRIAENPDIRFLRRDGSYAVYEIGSGEYRFESDWTP